MSKWIDADALEFTHAIARSLDDGHNWNELCITADEIADAPSIDIVRCKDCKWYDDEDYGEPIRYCTWHESVVKADDFCSYGEEADELVE